ncbi:GNAT family N-acetyltransferase [bacterium]|nr:GNAT family N-acetyltransferase [bacterium]
MFLLVTHSNSNPQANADNAETNIVSVETPNFHRALEVLDEAFPDVNRGFFYAFPQHDPFYKPEFSLALKKGNRLVSFLQIFDRQIRLEDKAIRIGGIGSVGTRTKEQGNGHATHLLTHAIDLMEQEGMEGSILFTKIPSFYERLGWNTIPQFEQEISVASLKTIRPSFQHYRRVEEKDCEKILSIYSRHAQQVSGLVQRTPEYWDGRVHWMNHIPIVVLNNQEVVGYFYMTRYDLAKPVMHITEIGMANAEPKTIELMLGSMARKAEEVSCTALRGFFRRLPAMNEYLDSHQLIQEDRSHNYLMWRDLSSYQHLETLLNFAARNRFLYWQTDAF